VTDIRLSLRRLHHCQRSEVVTSAVRQGIAGLSQTLGSCIAWLFWQGRTRLMFSSHTKLLLKVLRLLLMYIL